MFIYNFKAASSAQTKTFSRFERTFAKLWTSPLVPVGLFIGHLYLIALFLRNPFQKIDLD